METEPSGVPAVGSLESWSTTRVAALLSHAGNQRVLLDWLQEQDRYETVPDEPAALPEFDLDAILVDEHALREHDAEIRKRKLEAGAFLPVLLVSSGAPADVLDDWDRTGTADTDQQVVDEVITTPIDTAELRSRLDTLARVRAQSLALQRKTDQLLLLNRVTRHDIRNDVNVIIARAEQLEAHTDETGERILGGILDSSRHVVGLTAAVRELVEALQTDGDPDLQVMNLGEVLTDDLANRRSAFDDATFVVTGDIPWVHVRANDLLTSVFENVLNNAVQHNDADTPRVEVTVTEGDAVVTVTIADNGPGIPPDQRDAVLGRTDRDLDHPAAGLGLYLVDTLVGQYGGTLRVGDADLGGTAVTIELPKEQSADASASDHDS